MQDNTGKETPSLHCLFQRCSLLPALLIFESTLVPDSRLLHMPGLLARLTSPYLHWHFVNFGLTTTC